MDNSNKIETIVRAIIIYDKKILVCRAKDKSHYFLPGGHVEANESLESALEREIKEETGQHVTSSNHLTNLPNTFTTDGKTHQEINHVFRVELSNYKIKSRENHIEFEWIQTEQIKEKNILPRNMKDFVLNHLKNPIFTD